MVTLVNNIMFFLSTYVGENLYCSDFSSTVLFMLEQIDLRMRQSMHFVFLNRPILTPIEYILLHTESVCIIFSLCISLKFIEQVHTL